MKKVLSFAQVLAATAIATALGIYGNAAQASGMVPATSVLIIREADGEATMQVTNSDSHVSLLHVSLQDVPEDLEPLLLVTPPLSRVESGKSQAVRFVLMDRVGKAPLTVQRMKRVIFAGIPPTREKSNAAKVGVTVQQNLPVIIHPKGLAENRKPWEGLNWVVEGGALMASNPSPYVVRMAQTVKLLPSNATVTLPKTYLLPGETMTAPIPATEVAVEKVVLQPATVYGYAVQNYEAVVVRK
ncbi:fimbria/pilus chaperone family protein [Stenotrophomonas maltophilia]|uniref:fimbria/pilus chaperone family protein n=1 Tax=Stenotrophomonas maltophilia TaxID=40324 RepID=UPI001559F3D1|nr:fimbria/pilus chaperone family protein [Stenotrophomonas maltophilia]